jgi:hypothetical protein
VKNQCDKHGCSELLCGCPTESLLYPKQIEIIKAKDKWINQLLDMQVILTKALEFYADDDYYSADYCIDLGDCTPVLVDSGKQARKALEEIEKYEKKHS